MNTGRNTGIQDILILRDVFNKRAREREREREREKERERGNARRVFYTRRSLTSWIFSVPTVLAMTFL